MTQPDVRDLLVEAMIGPAMELVGKVGDGDARGVEAILTGLDAERLYALAVVLAAMVPDDVPLGDLMGPPPALPPVTPAEAEENRRVLEEASKLEFPDRGPVVPSVTRATHPILAALAAARYEQGLSLNAVADIAGYSRSAIGTWEHGECDPGVHALEDYAAALGFDLQLVMKRDGAQLAVVADYEQVAS